MPVSEPEDLWIPLVDEPIGSIVAEIQRENADIDALVSTPHRLLAFKTFAYMKDGIVLGELLASESDLETALEKFMDRRYERCKMVVENSVQLSEWEKNAAEHEEDAGRLQTESFMALAAPI